MRLQYSYAPGPRNARRIGKKYAMFNRDYLLIDFGLCRRDEVFGAYQDLGVLCAGKAPSLVLLLTAGEDADAHYALRDVLLTVSRVEAARPIRMKVALVTRRDEIADVGLAMQEELQGLGCKLHIFRCDRHAVRWLRSAAPHQPEPIRAAALA